MQKSATVSKLGLLAGLCSVLSAHSVSAGSVSYSGGNCASPICYGSTDFGSLSTPTSITFSDTMGLNSTGSAITVTDNWTFALPIATTGGSVAGMQLNLTNWSFTSPIISFQLLSVGSGGATTLLANGPFSSVLLDPTVTGGDYELQVVASLSAHSIGGYTGKFVAGSAVSGESVAAAPEIDPASAASGLTLLFGGLTLVRGRKSKK